MKYFNIFGTNTTASAGMSAEMKTYYSDYLIDFAKPNLVHNQFGQKQGIPANNGKTVEFRKYSPFAKATTLTEGVDPSSTDLTVSTVTATVAQYGAMVKLTDVLLLTAIDNNLTQAVELLGDQAGRTLDTVTREVINAGTNVQYGANAVTARYKLVGGDATPANNHYMNVDCIRRAVRTLRKNNAKTIDGKNFVAIIHPDVAYDLMNDSKWEAVSDYSAPENWFAGEIGRIAGVRFVESTEAKIFHADDIDATCKKVLNVNGAVSDAKSITVDETLTEAKIKGRKLICGNVITECDAFTSAHVFTVKDKVTLADDAKIYVGEAGAQGRDVYSTLVLGANAYGVIDVSGGGLQTIIKDKSEAGSALDLYATAGWKALATACILENSFMVRIETTSTFESGAN